MTELIRLTHETLHWFAPLIDQYWCDRIEQQQDTYAIGAVVDQAACGILVFQIRPPVVEIREMVVAPAYRRQGIAKSMVEYLCRYADKTATPVLCSFAAADKQDPVYLFFAEMWQFTVAQEDGMVCQVPLASLPGNQQLMALGGKPIDVQPFFSLPMPVRGQFLRRLGRQAALLPDDLDNAGLRPDLCLCAMDGNTVQAAIFVAEDGDDLELSFLWCMAGAHLPLMRLLAQAVKRLPQKTGNLRIAAVTPASVAIVDKLLPERQVIAQYYQAAWDMEW